MEAPTQFAKGNYSRETTVDVRVGSGKRGARYRFSDKQISIDFDALEAAFSSPLIWWASPPSQEQLEAMVKNSYCFGLHLLPESDPEDRSEMIGFARLVTDYVTFAYLTDVYVLEEHQGRGLGRFMMECVHEVLGTWPDLRRGMLITNRGSNAERTYRRIFGAIDIRERPAKEGVGELMAMEWRYKK